MWATQYNAYDLEGPVQSTVLYAKQPLAGNTDIVRRIKVIV